MELFTYYRSTSSYRVRIALALKGLDYQSVAVNLIAAGGGEHRQPHYLKLNPQGRVPALRTDDGEVLTQLTSDEVRALTASGVIAGGMIPKVKCCVEAVTGGVSRTHIVDGRVPHSILLEIFTKEGVGTMVVNE